jgi:hypothetical protein
VAIARSASEGWGGGVIVSIAGAITNRRAELEAAGSDVRGPGRARPRGDLESLVLLDALGIIEP